ncbi:MAG: S41 family peptidase, partial [Chlamydiae bacterium]|nr:S41 family peptidase [Chlamydiota bacterium]
AKNKIQEILKSHYKYKQVNTLLAQRALGNFLDELDPMKIYLSEKEISTYLYPSDELLERIVVEFQRERFTIFEEIYHTMIQSIYRRTELESTLKNSFYDENYPKDWTEWAKDDKELTKRLHVIQKLHAETSEKFPTAEQAELYQQRIKQRREMRESEMILTSEQSRKQQMLSYVIKAFAGSLDTHTVYFTPAEASQFLIDLQQKLSGIGAVLKDDLKGLLVMRIIEGGPASLHKELRVGDRIIAVNHEPIIGLDIIQSVDMIRGQSGTPVILTLVRESVNDEGVSEKERFDIEIIRGDVIIQEQRFEARIEPAGDAMIAYLHLHSFYQDEANSSADDLKKALDNLKSQYKIDAVLLDLRGNLGGLLPQAVAVAGMFVKKGIIVSIKDNTEAVQHLRNFNESVDWDGPLVILTDKTSASASEIVAGALQDYGRAIVVGDKTTCGKGSYQTLTLELGPSCKVNKQGEYKVTRGMYYTVSGRSPQLTGVMANIEIPGIYSFLDFGETKSKYPLENESINPHFQDTFEDVHPFYKRKIKKTFSNNAQQPIEIWNNFIPQLKMNSSRRIALNENYQLFLKEAEKKEFSEEALEKIGRTDLQLEEAFNVTKDLIYLYKSSKKQ